MCRVKISILFFCFILTATFISGAESQKENDSAEAVGGLPLRVAKCHENEGKDCDIDYSNSNETGPLDSHEAMNTRDIKPRNKRSAGLHKKDFKNMLLGLYKKSEDVDKRQIQETEQLKSDASELLLELMVRIAAHPQQWNEVHTLLRKIDNDLITSKNILEDLQSEAYTTTTQQSETKANLESKTVDNVQRLIILLDNEDLRTNKHMNKSNTSTPEEDVKVINTDMNDKEKPTTTTEKVYPWNKSQAKNQNNHNLSRDIEFAFHRVTGKPLNYRSNLDKTTARNAYVAVSVIAPKKYGNQDNILEDELHQLKPWNHQDNLNKMENIRKKWFLRSERQN